MSVPLPLGEMVFPVIGCARCVVWCYRFCGVITRDANSLTRGVVTRHARQSVVVVVVVVTFSMTRFEPVWLFLRPFMMITVLTFTSSKTKIETLILLLWRGIRSRLAKFHSGTCLHYFICVHVHVYHDSTYYVHVHVCVCTCTEIRICTARVKTPLKLSRIGWTTIVQGSFFVGHSYLQFYCTCTCTRTCTCTCTCIANVHSFGGVVIESRLEYKIVINRCKTEM